MTATTIAANGMVAVLVLVVAAVAIAVGQWFLDPRPGTDSSARSPRTASSSAGNARGTGRTTRLVRPPYDYEREVDR